MFFGLDPYGLNFLLDAPPEKRASDTVVYYGNTTLDEAHMRNTELTVAQMLALNVAESFSAITVYLGHFDGNIQVGSLTTITSPIYKYIIRRRRIDESQYTFVSEVLASANISYIKDYLTVNHKSYEYIVTPVDINGIMGSSSTATTTQDFFGWVLVDEDNTFAYKFDLENNTGSIQVVEDLKIYDNYTEMAYISQGIRSYRVGNLETMPYSINGVEIEITVDTLNLIKAFINNKKPKYLKNTSGEIYKVMTSEFNYKFIDQIISQPYKISFKFIQIGVVE
jgi:hypothetical protein